MLYHNYPQQRTLVVAHSNQALNDVFSKTVQRDVPARYLLRLGMGQEDLDTDVDFSRTGAPLFVPWRCLALTFSMERVASHISIVPGSACSECCGFSMLLHSQDVCCVIRNH